MATVILGTAGGALGGLLGGPIGAILGRAAGALVGSFFDNAIVNALTPPARREGPRLTTSDIQGATEDTAIGRVYGRARLTGNIFWATRYLEEITEETTGGKGNTGPEPETVTVEYRYSANFAVGFCEGVAAGFGRVFADGKEIDQSLYTIRKYLGSESQVADPLLEAKEGEAPAYRGLSYLVFEHLPIETWGNRIPQIAAEVFRPTGTLEGAVPGVAIIAGNEFGFDVEQVRQTSTAGGVSENEANLEAETDFLASIDRLEALCPNLTSVMLVVPWFGDDLRVGNCTIRPKVDSADKETDLAWVVSGLTRSTALVVSYIDGAAAFGGSPNDASVIRALQELQSRGIAVTLCPFIMMDVAAGNVLPNPYSNNAATAGQPLYPWRGRITVSPAAGFTGTVDKTATAATQISTFVGTAAAGDFGGSGTTVTYSGPAEWTYRRFVLHYAKLAQLSGAVSSFLIGSEMIGLTQARSSATAYPFVTALKTLAADVSGILGGSVAVGYAADWSEWNNHRPADGSNDVLFNLDPLWSDANIDFVGIDNYLPLSDWRDGGEHLDFSASGPTTVYDRDYLEGNVRGGEYFDWYYADLAARKAQTRTTIADGNPANEPWIYRQKALLEWWQNTHHSRPGGVRDVGVTGWTASMKPIRFTELGCPAVDKASNQPNVFPDPKSSESSFPHFSSRARDDVMQRAYIEAMLGFYGDPANNPVVSTVPLVDLDLTNLWCWDARPWPSFPLDTRWGDAANWETGHWLSARLGSAPAAETIAQICADAGFAAYAIEPIPGCVDAVTVGGIITPRALLEGLMPAYGFDAVESEGVIKFEARLGRAPLMTLDPGELVVTDPEAPKAYRRTRAQPTELPDAIKVTFGDSARDDQPAGVEARRSAGQSHRVLSYRPPVVAAESMARQMAEIELHAAWVGSERVEMVLPPSLLALDPGDVVSFLGDDFRLSSIGDGEGLPAEAFRTEFAGHAPVPFRNSGGRAFAQTILLPADLTIVDGAMLRDSDLDHAGYLGGVLAPFRGGLAAWRSPTTSGYVLDTLLTVPATAGVLTGDFYSGPEQRWDRVNSLYLELARGSLSSAAEEFVLNGANVLMVENADGEWEYLQFATATPNGGRNYILSGLIRGVRGTEHAMRDPVAAGARVLLVTGAVKQTGLSPAHIGLALNWKAGPAAEDIGSASYQSFAFTMAGRGRRPLSPVHLRGIKNTGTGDWALSWIRRTRLGGDSWDQVDVPLGEEIEGYRLEILDGPGGAVLRTFDTSVPSQLYTATQQTADFGTPQSSFWASVAQISASYGRGIDHSNLIEVR